MIAMTTEKDDLSRDPDLEALYTEAAALAKADVEADRDPQVLTGRLAPAAWVYEETYLEQLCIKGAN